VIASEVDGGETHYESKRHIAALDKAPVDFQHDPTRPVALIAKGSA